MDNTNISSSQHIITSNDSDLSIKNMEKIENALAIEFAMADFDLFGDDLDTKTINKDSIAIPFIFTNAIKEWQTKRAPAKKIDAQQGHTSQIYDEIDEYRKTPEGKESRSLIRKNKRFLEALKEGREIKPRRSKLTPEQRQEDNCNRQANHRKKMTPAEKKEASRKRQIRRENEKKRKQQALIDQALF